MRNRAISLLAGLSLAGTVMSACGSAGGSGTELSLVAYSTPQAAYDKIIKAFEQTPAGKNISFKQSYGASGDQSRAVDSGQPADIVAFSLAPDITRLVKDGIVSASWSQNKYQGMVTDSVVSLVVRKGNPKHITNWSDLVRNGVKVVTPNPFSSGSAQWNIMGAYGSQIKAGDSPARAKSYLTSVLQHTAVQDESGRKALQTFVGGTGDVLISYENEAIFAQQNHQPVDYVTPSDTLLIENPVAITKTTKHPKQATAFLQFLYSKKAQQIFADNGYRPIVPGVATGKYKKPAGLFTIDDFGGWPTVTTKFFDPQHGIVAGIEKKLGVSIGK